MKEKLLLLFTVVMLGTPASACSCVAQTTFCNTLHAPMNPEWWTPDLIILGVKTGEALYGINVHTLEVLHGDAQPGQDLFAWADCGFTCRPFPDTWADGDTVVWAMQFTDMQGNFVCGSQLEEEGDLMISICGIYWLSYANGMVTGAITSETEETMSMDALQDVIGSCLVTGVDELADGPSLEVGYDGTGVWLGLPATAAVELTVFDAMGRTCLREGWNGTRRELAGLVPGTYCVQVQRGSQRTLRKVMVP